MLCEQYVLTHSQIVESNALVLVGFSEPHSLELTLCM